jgi:biotin carboxyl carrier protein
VPDTAWQAAARALLAADGEWTGGWRLNGSPRLRLIADGDSATERSITVARGRADTDGTGEPALVASADAEGRVVHVDVAGRSVAVRLAPPPDVDRAVRAAAAHHGGGPAEVVAPMPGAIITVHRRAGDAVEAGDPIVTLEAMKMEHIVAAPLSGTLAEVTARRGQQVVRGQVLATVEP